MANSVQKLENSSKAPLVKGNGLKDSRLEVSRNLTGRGSGRLSGLEIYPLGPLYK